MSLSAQTKEKNKWITDRAVEIAGFTRAQAKGTFQINRYTIAVQQATMEWNVEFGGATANPYV